MRRLWASKELGSEVLITEYFFPMIFYNVRSVSWKKVMFTPRQKSCPELESTSKKDLCLNAKEERKFFRVQSIILNKLRNTDTFFSRQLPQPRPRAQTLKPDCLVSILAFVLSELVALAKHFIFQCLVFFCFKYGATKRKYWQ